MIFNLGDLMSIRHPVVVFRSALQWQSYVYDE